MKLDPKALEKAALAVLRKRAHPAAMPPDLKRWPSSTRDAEAAVRTYLTAIGETHVLVPRGELPLSVKTAIWDQLEKSAAVGNLTKGNIRGDGHPDVLWSIILSHLAAAKEGE